jgi:hypothetical protein
LTSGVSCAKCLIIDLITVNTASAIRSIALAIVWAECEGFSDFSVNSEARAVQIAVAL